MAARAVRLVACALAVVALAGCGSDAPAEDAPPDFASCGLPEPDPKADASLIPEPLLLGGEAEVAKTVVEEGRVIGALNVPYPVGEAFTRYKEALGKTELEILQEDNEGFEAELYLKEGKELGSLQIRSSTCDTAVVVYLNLPAP